MRKLTYVLLFLLAFAVLFSLLRKRETFVAGYPPSQQDPRVERSNRAKRAFPVAEFNESDPDSVAGRSRKEKRQRYDLFEMVAAKPEPWIAETVATPEGVFNFPRCR
jgi:hypothetical protein